MPGFADSFHNARVAALAYRQRGWSPIPVPRGRKAPITEAWQNQRLDEADILAQFSGAENVGVLLGTPSDGLTDIDLDCAEAIFIASGFLPPTAAIFGRPSKPRSHRLYKCDPPALTKQFRDTTGEMLVELRATGLQTIFPPSIHPSGETVTWHEDGEPACVAYSALVSAVSHLAAAALVDRHWPEKGSRHEAAKALAGALTRAGWAQDIAEQFIVHVAQAAHDEETASRAADVRSTTKRLDNDGPATGLPTLAKIIGQDVVNKLSTWLALAPSRDGDVDVGLTNRLADAITADDHFAQDVGGKLYVYSSGVYLPSAERHIKRRVKALLNEWQLVNRWTRHRANEVVEYIHVDAVQLWEQPPLNTLNLKNGLLDLGSRELRPHSPEFLSPIRLPVDYDPAARCPEWDRQVRETFPADALAAGVPYEIPARLMTPDTSDQRADLFIGEGGTGKSTYLAGIRAFLGPDNVSALSLHRLETDRFAAARLVGKLANICADLPSGHLASAAMFKAITGGDPIPAERKFHDSFDFVPYARLIFSANHPPQSADASEAFFQRWRVTPFERQFRDTKNEIPRPTLDARLASQTELSGLLNRALDAAAQIRSAGLSETESMKRARDGFRAATDPLPIWLDRNVIEHPDALVPKADLWAAYNRDCQLHGRPCVTAQGFGRGLAAWRRGLRSAQRTIGGRIKEVYLGIGLRSQDDPPSHDGTGARMDRGYQQDNATANEAELTSADSGDSGDSSACKSGRGGQPVGGGPQNNRDQKSAEKHERAEPEPCRACGGMAFWRSIFGGLLACGRCHPPPARNLVDEWVGFETPQGPGRGADA